ncbi:helix-turn-helix domain-containing protein [Streptomyces sp. NPDC059578]|uniref:helix-turn-helix domain-containing protein n=1 Tax=unclassified Streptomyces TaxID=2593676 RepID=UPI00365739E2
MSAPGHSEFTAGLAPGENLAVLRKAHGLTQAQLARRAAVSLSLLSKIEVGDRALTPAVAAALGKPMGLTVAEVLGKAAVHQEAEESLTDLRSALRDYDVPTERTVTDGDLRDGVMRASALRDAFDVARLTQLLPNLLRDATAHAFAVHSAEAWNSLAEAYSAVYWLAARHRWMDMAELAVTRQRWAVDQRADPLGAAIADRDRAGAYLNGGDYEGGLSLVERAIVAAQSGPSLSGRERAFAVGVLNLRGMTLAGRLEDKSEGRREAERHIRSAWNAAEELAGVEWNRHSMIFGVRNTTTHVLATRLDLGSPREALAMAADVDAALVDLTPTRVAATRINLARAGLDVGDRDGALTNLRIAWETAPQMARMNPMGREVFRVVSSLHRRSNPELLRMAKLAGIPL